MLVSDIIVNVSPPQFSTENWSTRIYKFGRAVPKGFRQYLPARLTAMNLDARVNVTIHRKAETHIMVTTSEKWAEVTRVVLDVISEEFGGTRLTVKEDEPITMVVTSTWEHGQTIRNVVGISYVQT